MKKIIASFLIITYSAAAFSHSGGTNDSGCHNDNSPGGYYHCHNDSSGSDAGAALGVLAAVALIALLFRGGSQQVISDPDKSKPTETTTTPSNNNSKNRSLPLSQQVAN
jgi:hypothetical protein